MRVLKTKIDELQESIGALLHTLIRNDQDSHKHQEKILLLEKKKEAFKVCVKLIERKNTITDKSRS